MKLKMSSKNYKSLQIKIYEKVSQGWEVVRDPKKNIFDVWAVKMQKKDPKGQL
jgi:hypothetical protein